jgi:polyisoprenyl-teichoic acid--peptidoglycan teichoic acid transferase
MRQRLTQTGPVIAAAIVVLLASLGLVFNNSGSQARIVVGKAKEVPMPKAVVEPGPPEVPLPPRLLPAPLLGAGGNGNGSALAFRGAVNVPGDLKFFLVIGSDARPGQNVLRSRADSIHIAAVDPLTRKGTLIGLPRDSYVNVPGHGRSKINAALAWGGPDLLVRSVRELTGLPISYWAVTAFDGIAKIVDALHGVDVKVPYRMNDRYSGARFEPGWHHMNGNQVLAFSRARHGVPGGDFGRSENQGRVIVHSLEKMRHETRDESGIRKWLDVLYNHARLDMSMSDAVKLGVLARQIVPSNLRNVVAQGSSENRSGQSVVVLNESAYALFRDVGADAEADGDQKRDKPTGSGGGTEGGGGDGPTPTKRPKATPKPTPIIPLPEL